MRSRVVLCGVLRVPHRPGLAWGLAVVGVWVPIGNFSGMMQVIPEVP